MSNAQQAEALHSATMPTNSDINALVLEMRQAGTDSTYEIVIAALSRWAAPAAQAVELVASVYTMEALVPGGREVSHVTLHKPLPSGIKLYAAPAAVAVPDAAQIKELMKKHRIWVEHSTLYEDDLPPRELRAIQAEQHQFEAYTKDLLALAAAPAVPAPAADAATTQPQMGDSPASTVETPPAQAQTFQQRVQPWMQECFGAEISADGRERNHRFLEEALELVQALGCTESEARQLVAYVYGRPEGEPAQEVGGVMVTLAALCLAHSLDMHTAGDVELARIWTKVDAIRAKQAAKPKHSPLPMHAPEALDDTALLDAMTTNRIAVAPEFQGPWDAELYGEEGEPVACGSGNTPREAIRAAIAATAAQGEA